MYETGDGPAPAPSATTDFEGRSHREMLEMISGVKPENIRALADQLHQVAKTMVDIGSQLQSHTSRVVWDGQAGDTFRGWSSRVSSATFTLSAYSETAGGWMGHVGDTLSRVKGDMPAIPEGAASTVATYRQSKGIYGPWAFADDYAGAAVAPAAKPPTEAEYQHALSQMEAARIAAADHMKKLGSAYNQASHMMSVETKPVFEPPPPQIMPPQRQQIDGIEYVSAGPPSGTGSGSATGRAGSTPPTREADSDSAARQRLGSGGSDHSGTSMHVDGVGALPHVTSAVPALPHRDGARDVPHGKSSSDFMPVRVIDDVYRRSPIGNRWSEGKADRAEKLPLVARKSVGDGVSPPDAVDDGVHGGRPGDRNTPGTQRRFSQGAVVGEERPLSRAFNGSSSNTSGGRGQVAAGALPGPRGRSIATEPEGNIGGRRGLQMNPGDEFTPGGSGLMPTNPEEGPNTRQGMPGIGGVPSGTPSGHGGRSGGRRPDYLVEEETTWVAGGRKVVPPVVE